MPPGTVLTKPLRCLLDQNPAGNTLKIAFIINITTLQMLNRTQTLIMEVISTKALVKAKVTTVNV